MHNGKNGHFLHGIIIGAVAGAAVGFAVTPKSRGCKRVTGRVLRTCGDIIDTVGNVMK